MLMKTVSFALLLLASSFTWSQDQPTPSQSSPPFLERCTASNPPPCADKAPYPFYAPDPEYSKEAWKAKIDGIVVLTVVVGTDGRAHDISVVKPLGYGLDEEAVKAVKKWRFRPGKSSGKLVPVQIHVEEEFRYPGR